MDPHNANKAIISALRSALYDFDRGRLSSVVKNVFDPGCAVHLANPFEDLDGPGGIEESGGPPNAKAVGAHAGGRNALSGGRTLEHGRAAR